MTDLVTEEDLSSFFRTIAIAKTKKKKEIEELVSNSFDDLFLKPLQEKTSRPSRKQQITETISIQEKKKEEPNYISIPKNKQISKDPLIPLDQKFVTLEDLNKHYNLFLNRIQQQLASLGGGGETNLAFMDVPIATVTSSYYQIKHSDYYIGINYEGPVTVILPKADRQGKKFVVKDESGNASKGTNRYITILPTGSDLIDNRDKAILAYDYGSLTFIWKDDCWRVV